MITKAKAAAVLAGVAILGIGGVALAHGKRKGGGGGGFAGPSGPMTPEEQEAQTADDIATALDQQFPNTSGNVIGVESSGGGPAPLPQGPGYDPGSEWQMGALGDGIDPGAVYREAYWRQILSRSKPRGLTLGAVSPSRLMQGSLGAIGFRGVSPRHFG